MITFKTTVLRVLFLLVILGTALTVNAGGILKVVPVEKSGKAVVRIANFDSESIRLSIEDANRNEVYYSEKLSNDADFAKVFDLSLLQDGYYVFVVNTGDEILKEEFEIVDSHLSVEDKVKLKEPIFRVKNDLLLIYLQDAVDGGYTVNFYDENGKFFSDEINDVSKVKQYSLKELPRGEYTVMVNSSTGAFRHLFSKE